jgi:hypothetical protein
MSRLFVSVVLSTMLFALCVAAEAQQPKKISQIGVLLPWAPASGVGQPLTSWVFHKYRFRIR